MRIPLLDDVLPPVADRARPLPPVADRARPLPSVALVAAGLCAVGLSALAGCGDCGGEPPAADAGRVDAGPDDAGPDDGGVGPDGGSEDGGVTDAVVVGDTCADITEDIVPDVPVHASTLAAAFDVDAPCGPGGAAPDVALRFTLTEAAGVEVRIHGDDGVDPVAFVGAADCTGFTADRCSDVLGRDELLQVGTLPAGVWSIVVRTPESAGAFGAGGFDVTLHLDDAGLCVDDDFDRGGFGDTPGTALALGHSDVDTADGLAGAGGLVSCPGDDDWLLVGHMGGDLQVDVQTVDGALLAGDVIEGVPVRSGGEIVVGDDVVVDEGALLGGLPYHAATAAGMVLVRVAGGGGPYSARVHHACPADAFDSPIAELDDATPATAGTVLTESATLDTPRVLCGTDRDVLLVSLPNGGDAEVRLAGGGALRAALAAVDPVTLAESPRAVRAVQDGDDLVVTLAGSPPGLFALTLDPPAEGFAVAYGVDATLPPPPDPCAATALSGSSGSAAGSTLGGLAALDPSSAPFSPPSCLAGGAAGPEVLYRFDAPAAADTLFTVRASFDAALYAFSSCPPVSCLTGVDDDGRSTTNDETLLVPAGSGTVFVAVDSFSPRARGAYTLQWAPTTPPPLPLCGDGVVEEGETCDDGQPVPLDGDGCDGVCAVELGYTCPPEGGRCQAVPAATGGDTCADVPSFPLLRSAPSTVVVDAVGQGAHADTAGTCGGLSGPEVIFRVDVTEARTLHASTRGGDTVLYARSGDCAGGTELACNDDATGATAGESAVDFAATPGTPVYLFVDFFPPVPPPVELTVE